jgi:hypothetical protein
MSVKPLTARQRRALVEAPFPLTRVIPSDKTWAGCSFQELDSFFHEITRERRGKDYDAVDPDPEPIPVEDL